jgi:hypothetical protein
MRRKVTVVVLCVCLSVTTKSCTYLVYTWETRCHRVLYGVFKVFVVWLSLKTLRSRVMASFAGHRCFLAPCGELSMFPSTVMAYSQLEGCVWLAIYRLNPTIQLAHQFVLAQCQISFLTFLLVDPCPQLQATPTFHPALGGAYMLGSLYWYGSTVSYSLANFGHMLYCSQRASADGSAPRVFI